MLGAWCRVFVYLASVIFLIALAFLSSFVVSPALGFFSFFPLFYLGTPGLCCIISCDGSGLGVLGWVGWVGSGTT